MERSDLDNANPTILNVSQLPSRRQKQSAARKGPENRYDDVLFSKKQSGAYGFGNRVSSWPSSDEEDDADLPEEPIDELEIYGKQKTEFEFCYATRGGKVYAANV